MSAIADLIAAARDQSRGGTPADEDRWGELADAAEKELEELRPKVVGESFFMPTWTKLSPKDAKAYAEYRRSQFKPLEPRIDLEALRKYLGHSKEGWRQMMAQLEGAKGQPCTCDVGQDCDVCCPRPVPVAVPISAPKPEAQTCGGCAGRGGEHSATGVSTCQQCNGTGKVGGGK